MSQKEVLLELTNEDSMYPVSVRIDHISYVSKNQYGKTIVNLIGGQTIHVREKYLDVLTEWNNFYKLVSLHENTVGV